MCFYSMQKTFQKQARPAQASSQSGSRAPRHPTQTQLGSGHESPAHRLPKHPPSPKPGDAPCRFAVLLATTKTKKIPSSSILSPSPRGARILSQNFFPKTNGICPREDRAMCLIQRPWIQGRRGRRRRRGGRKIHGRRCTRTRARKRGHRRGRRLHTWIRRRSRGC